MSQYHLPEAGVAAVNYKVNPDKKRFGYNGPINRK